MGFPCGSACDSSVGKESACNAGDSGSIPGLGRSSREGIGYPLQYSWGSLVAQLVIAQLVKNPPAMRETWVQSLGWEDPPGKGKGYPFQYSGLENSKDDIINQSMGLQRVGQKMNKPSQFQNNYPTNIETPKK